MAVRIEPHVTLRYFLAADYLERRSTFRGVHLELIDAARARGDLRLAGALADPADEALLIFIGDDPAVAIAFAQADPYVRNGLVERYEARVWSVVQPD